MGNFFAELKRRHIYRVAAAYAVVAWLLIQLVNNIMPLMKVPDWAGSLVLVLLAVGFPVSVLFAWIHELKSPDSAAAQRASTGILDWALMAALVAVLTAVAYQQLTAQRPTLLAARQPGVDAAREAAAKPAGISVAVLPFTNLSDDRAQEFFSDGMTEEIVSALAKIPDLRVVGRASAFQFKGQNRDLRSIGQALNATHLIEGSVRKEGDRVRIAAELVKVDDGLNIWRDSYDRQLTGVFAVQEEIATAIAGALKMPLGLNQGELLVSNRTIDPESYQQYLRARALVRARNVNEAATILEALVARSPNYAPAWALLSTNEGLVRTYNQASTESRSFEEQLRVDEALLDRREKAAREAIRLDPKLALGYASLGVVEASRGKLLVSDGLYKQALALDPNDPDVLDNYSQRLANRGYINEALRLGTQLRMLEPFVPIYGFLNAEYLYSASQNDAAIRMLEAVSTSGAEVGYIRNLYLAKAYATAGRYRDAADTLLAIPANQNSVSRRFIEDAARVLRDAPAAGAPDTLPAFDDNMFFVYAHVGAFDRILDLMERRKGRLTDRSWDPAYAPLRKTERFKTLMRKDGMIDYWRARGWPDMCHPTSADDFECN